MKPLDDVFLTNEILLEQAFAREMHLESVERLRLYNRTKADGLDALAELHRKKALDYQHLARIRYYDAQMMLRANVTYRQAKEDGLI